MLLGTTGRCLYFAERPKHFQLPAVSAHTYISSDEDEKAPCRKRKRPYSCEQQCSAKKTKTCRLPQEKEAVATCASPAKTKCCPSIVYIMQLLLPFEHPAQTGSQNEKKNNSHSRGIFAAHRGYQIWLTQQRSPHTTVFCYKLEGHKTPGTRSFFARY